MCWSCLIHLRYVHVVFSSCLVNGLHWMNSFRYYPDTETECPFGKFSFFHRNRFIFSRNSSLFCSIALHPLLFPSLYLALSLPFSFSPSLSLFSLFFAVFLPFSKKLLDLQPFKNLVSSRNCPLFSSRKSNVSFISAFNLNLFRLFD